MYITKAKLTHKIVEYMILKKLLFHLIVISFFW